MGKPGPRCPVDQQQLRIGARHESREHNVNIRRGAIIACPHIMEHRNYYRLMPKFERMLSQSERQGRQARVAQLQRGRRGR